MAISLHTLREEFESIPLLHLHLPYRNALSSQILRISIRKFVYSNVYQVSKGILLSRNRLPGDELIHLRNSFSQTFFHSQ